MGKQGRQIAIFLSQQACTKIEYSALEIVISTSSSIIEMSEYRDHHENDDRHNTHSWEILQSHLSLDI